MLRTQKWCIDLCVKKLVTFQAEALDSCQKRWTMSPTYVQNREPFGAPSFAQALSQVSRYVACVQTCGVQWIGLQFRFPIIWLPKKNYTPSYIVPDGWWKEFLLSEGYKVSGTDMVEEYDLAQLHEDDNHSNLDLWKW